MAIAEEAKPRPRVRVQTSPTTKAPEVKITATKIAANTNRTDDERLFESWPVRCMLLF